MPCLSSFGIRTGSADQFALYEFEYGPITTHDHAISLYLLLKSYYHPPPIKHD
jgi:hypothetical protein